MNTQVESRDNDSDGFWEEWPGYTENYIRCYEFASLSRPEKVRRGASQVCMPVWV